MTTNGNDRAQAVAGKEVLCPCCGNPLPERGHIICPSCGSRYHLDRGELVPFRATFRPGALQALVDGLLWARRHAVGRSAQTGDSEAKQGAP